MPLACQHWILLSSAHTLGVKICFDCDLSPAGGMTYSFSLIAPAMRNKAACGMRHGSNS